MIHSKMWLEPAFFFVLSGCCSFAVTPSIITDHYDGKRFYNQDRSVELGFREFLSWVLNRKGGPWPKWVEAQPGPKPPIRVAGHRLRVTFINHATVLIQMQGLNILTDPIWSDRSSPVCFAGPKRVRPPGIRFEDLPPIDVVVVSHNHYDHLDLPTLKDLYKKHKPDIYVPLGNKPLLERAGILQVRELDWWQQVQLTQSVRLTCVPAQHFSGRGIWDRNKVLWGGYVFDGPNGSIYFAGDTGFGLHFEQIAQHFNQIRLALLPIGAYRPEWFMGPNHISPRGALKAHEILKARTSIAVHFGTFPLGDDGQTEATDTLSDVLSETNPGSPRFLIPDFGTGIEVPFIGKAEDGQ